jgi:hypothetical protein
MPKNIGSLLLLEGHVDGDHDSADVTESKPDIEKLRAIRQVDTYTITFFYFQSQKPLRSPMYIFLKYSI